MICYAVFLIFLAQFANAQDKPCIDDPNVKCEDFKDDCATEKMIPLLKESCPVTCKLCPPTEAPTTLAPCFDDKDTDCASFKQFCSNSKYIPMLKSFCPVTCNMCPGATTVMPTPNPNCQDNGPNCAGWVKNGYCNKCFYKCSEREKYCAKSCGFCTPGTCKDCNSLETLFSFGANKLF